MDNKYLIIIIAAVIIAAVAAVFAFTYHPVQDVQLDVIGNGSVPEDGSIAVKLSTLNGTALKNKKVHVSVFNSKGKMVFNKTEKTSGNGKASFDLKNVTAGKKYTVNVTFDGDKNYSANATSEKIKIVEKKVVETAPEPTQAVSEEPNSQQSQEYDIDDMDGDGQLDVFYSEGYYDDVGMVQYYDTRGGEHLEVYDDGSYYYQGADGSEDYGYVY